MDACSDDSTPAAGNSATASAQQGAPEAPAPTGALTGLYEGQGDPKSQMCVLDGKARPEFALVVWGGNNHSCSGSGTIAREGNRLRLKMNGDSPCTVEARLSGSTIEFESEQPAGCAYYCGARARLAGAHLTRTGATRVDAMKAKDLVGEPLCSAEG
jgi:hypothetical protein